MQCLCCFVFLFWFFKLNLANQIFEIFFAEPKNCLQVCVLCERQNCTSQFDKKKTTQKPLNNTKIYGKNQQPETKTQIET